jgi:uncharacterized protein YjbJ (UPF0337 family)
MDPGLIASPLAPFERKDFAMNKDRIAGSAKQAAGTIKQGVGHAVGDAKLETDGKIEVATGKLQNAKGSLKDALKR